MWLCGRLFSRLGLVSKSQEFIHAEIIKTYCLCYLSLWVCDVWVWRCNWMCGAQGTTLWSRFSYLSVGSGVKLRLSGLWGKHFACWACLPALTYSWFYINNIAKKCNGIFLTWGEKKLMGMLGVGGWEAPWLPISVCLFLSFCVSVSMSVSVSLCLSLPHVSSPAPCSWVLGLQAWAPTPGCESSLC